MAFKPKISIVAFPRDSQSITIKDITEAYDVDTNPGGYGGPTGPGAFDDLYSFLFQFQLFGANPIIAPLSDVTGDMTDGTKIVYNFADGVTIIRALYGVQDSQDFEVSADGYTITVTQTGDDFDAAWEGVVGVTDPTDPTTLYRFKSTNRETGVIELYTAWPDMNYTYTENIVKYYEALKRIMVLNCGEKNIVGDISNMAVSKSGCDHDATMELFERIMLKMSAQTAFNCGNYTKAHAAATLLCSSKSIFKPCATC
jgi:hypothetical protein